MPCMQNQGFRNTFKDIVIVLFMLSFIGPIILPFANCKVNTAV